MNRLHLLYMHKDIQQTTSYHRDILIIIKSPHTEIPRNLLRPQRN